MIGAEGRRDCSFDFSVFLVLQTKSPAMRKEAPETACQERAEWKRLRCEGQLHSGRAGDEDHGRAYFAQGQPSRCPSEFSCES